MRLFVLTLGLEVLLVIGIGAATALVTLRSLDADIDRALAASVDAAVASLHDGIPSGPASGDSEDAVLAASDTFLLVLDSSGNVISNPSHVNLPGIPDRLGFAAAQADGRDLRTVDTGGTPVRLLTVRILPGDDEESVNGFVQGGFVLTLHDEQSQSIASAILLAGGIGLIGAAVVTLIVTGRAFVPIRRSFDAQRRFVADASHELRTPAALIRANADVIEREGLVTDDGRPLVADIITEADRLARLVGDLLQLAATDATGIIIEPRPVDLGAVATETVRQARALASGRAVDLVIQVPTPGSAVVSGDRDRLVQLLLILLDNAFDHSPPGGTVTVDVHRAGTGVEMAIVDEGPGIPVAERERVFEPFTRLPGVRRDRSGGTGLGLAIARRIATAHQGTIQVADATGGGAAVIVTIPSVGGSATS